MQKILCRRTYNSRGFFLFILCAFSLVKNPARADCFEGKNTIVHQVENDPGDTSPPGQVTLESIEVVRGQEVEGTLCLSIGSLGFLVEPAAGDVDEESSLGYLVEWLSGSPETDRFVEGQGPGVALRSVDGVVWLNFLDRREEPLSGAFRIAAVDEAGNQGPFSNEVVAEHLGVSSGGCSTAGGGSSGLPGVFAVFGLGVLLLRTRQGGQGPP
ncbi:MAG: hypothetical protein JXR96_27170 [Deltaproteobacteria bacterium]|nr:hypothetical protein [Deltaproteobacteria bacterium]